MRATQRHRQPAKAGCVGASVARNMYKKYSMKRIEIQNGVWIVNDFLSERECNEWIKFSESEGYEIAKIGQGRRQVLNTAIRNNDRVIYDDEDLSEEYFRKSYDFLIPELPISKVSGLNSRFRFYKYSVGQRFKQHQDGSYIKSINEWSEFTFMVYLNDDFQGGETKFIRSIVRPKRGCLLLFKHELIHEGCPVLEGVKYVLRTDVMYKRKLDVGA